MAICLAAGLSTAANPEPGTPAANDALDPQTQADARASIEAQRQAELDRASAAARSDRADSQDRYADASDSEAFAIAREQFPQLISEPAFDPFRPDPGETVERYVDHSEGALLETADGETALVDSPLPLRGTTDAGDLRPVDLTLERTDGRFEPKASPVRASLPSTPAAGVALPYGGGTLTIRPEQLDPSAEPRVEADKLFYANSTRDTDLVAAALPTGAELSDVLRSADSPETIAYRFDGLPSGAELRATADGHAAELVRGGERLAAVAPPIAIDADGRSLPVTLAIEGDRLALTVAHRSRDVSYPVLLDPVFETFTWNGQQISDFEGWTYATIQGGGSPPHTVALNATRTNGTTSGLYTATNGGYLYSTDEGIDRFIAPGDAFVYRADYGPITHSAPTGINMCMSAKLVIPTTGVTDGSSWTNCASASNVSTGVCASGTWPNCVTTAGAAGNEARFSYWAWGSGTRPTGFAAGIKYLGGAVVYVNDRVKPTLQWHGSPPPSSWADNTGSAALDATDGGLGVQTVTVSSPTAPTWAPTPLATGCNGTRADRAAHRCDNPKTLEVDLSGLPEGAQTLRATATDAVGNAAAPIDYGIKIDRTAPSSVSFGGELGTDANKIVGQAQVGVTVSANDGLSGVANISYALARPSAPGTTLQQGSATNLVCSPSGCPASYAADFTVDTTGLSDGAYTLTARASDRVGHIKISTLNFTVDHNVINAAQAMSRFSAARPDAIAASTTATAESTTLEPTLEDASGGEYTEEETLRDGSVGDDYTDGFDVGNEGATVSVAPASVTADATAPMIANGDAAVFANTQYATDAVVRPTANGMETIAELRNASAPEGLSWRVDLASGQGLSTQPSGDTVVTDPEPPVRSVSSEPYPPEAPSPNDVYTAPDVSEVDDPFGSGTAPPDTSAVGQNPPITTRDLPPGVPVLSAPNATNAANNTAGQVNRETSAAAAAQNQLSQGTAQAVFLAPRAHDANGASVPVTTSTSGGMLSYSIPHRGRGYAYPVTITSEISAAGDDGGRSAELQAATDRKIEVMTWNLHGFAISDDTIDKMAKFIARRTNQPPIILLQEVCQNKRDLLVDKLKSYGWAMDSQWAPQKYLRNCHNSIEGSAILARPHEQLRDYDYYPFPFYKDDKEQYHRIDQSGTVSTVGHRLHLYNVHLSVTTAAKRHAQISTAAFLARRWLASPDHSDDRVLVGGDFNQDDHTEALNAAFRDNNPVFSYAGPSCPDDQEGTVRGELWCFDQLYRQQDKLEAVSSVIVKKMTLSDHYPVKFNVQYK